MSDNDDDLFADSDDTAELMQNKPEPTKKPAKKKLGGGAAAKRKRNEGSKAKIPDADGDDDDDDDDDKGLFDSDDDDDEDDNDGGKKPAAKKAKKTASKKQPMSKRERMEALQKRKRAATASDDQPVVSGGPSEKKKPPKSANKEGGGGNNSDSEDSYDSAEFQLTEDDRNFIDTTGDDEDAINELYSEQHFDDVRGEAEEDGGGRKKGGKGGRGGGGGRRGDSLGEKDKADLDNPMMAAVHKMKKKKAVAKKLSELEEEAKEFMDRMERAAEEDELAIRERRPATKKLSMLNSVIEMFTRRDIMRVLLDLDVLSICRRWIQPLPNGTLGNVTIRQRLLDSIANMSGDSGITPGDLKRSEFGKVVMSLYMHKSETPAMKRQLKSLIEQWSRPIFQKSGNMRDLERVHAQRGESGIAGFSRQLQQDQKRTEAASSGGQTEKQNDIAAMIKSGKGKGKGSQLNRVRVPYSKGFQFTVRPTARTVQSPEKGGGKGQDARESLKKRMVEKNRAVSKNQRSANISIEGRATK